ncbi:MAG: nickel/cobalt transporter (NicO) family protein [Thermoleophilaceae bacterium]|nr:nickel/cobalt transporter (NicO) family protein [Thermoleophilaceae bacterium]
MRVALAALVAVLLLPAAAEAHPLGNFTINHLSRVSVSEQRVDVAYTLDQAEIPTFQERGQAPGTVLSRKLAEVRRGLRLTVDGRSAPLEVVPGARISFPEGQGGLRTTRVEVRLTAKSGRRVQLRDGTFPGRVGWKAVVVAPGAGTDVRSSVPATDPTDGLRHYPSDLLKSPLDQRSATLSVTPGSGRVTAPDGVHRGSATEDRSGDGLSGVFADAASGRGVLVLLLLAAFAWGALHALSPGHGKSMVAAYLVGTRGTARHAVALGATVTIAHTAGVFALGLVTLALSEYVLPEDLYPWLTLASGLLVVGVGVGVLRARLRSARKHDHHHHHHHDHEVSWRSLIAMGASAGLIPCPSALVVLLAALSQHQVALGLVLITAFSLGLAATITGIGLVVVYARTLVSRLNVSSGAASALPALSALVIVVVGCVLTAQAVPGVLA